MLIKKKYYSKKFPNVNFEKLLSHYNYNPGRYDIKIFFGGNDFVRFGNLEDFFSYLFIIPSEKTIDNVILVEYFRGI